MGICELPLIKRRNSIKLEDTPNEKKIVYPNGEIFYLKHISDAEKEILYDEIEIYFSFNGTNLVKDENKQIKLNIFYNSNQYNTELNYQNLGYTEELTISIIHAVICFQTGFLIRFHFERHQTLRIRAIIDGSVVDEIDFSIAKLMGSKGNTLILPLGKGELSVNGNQTRKSNYISKFDIELKFNSANLGGGTKRGPEQKDYFYVLSNIINGNSWVNVYKSEEFSLCDENGFIFKNSFSIRTSKLHIGDKMKDIKFEIYKRVRKGDGSNGSKENAEENVIISSTVAKVINLINDMNAYTVSLIKNSEEKGKLTINSGVIRANVSSEYLQKNTYGSRNGSVDPKDSLGTLKIQYSENEIYSFLEYIKGGLQVGLILSIDNLHSFKEMKSVISMFPEFVSEYDYDQNFTFITAEEENCSVPYKHFDEWLSIKCDNCKDSLNGQSVYELVQKSLSEIKKESESGGNKYYIMPIFLSNFKEAEVKEVGNLIVSASEHPVTILLITKEVNKDLSEINNVEKQIINSSGEKVKRDTAQYYSLSNFYTDGVLNTLQVYEKMFKEVPINVEDYYEMQKGMKFSLLSGQ